MRFLVSCVLAACGGTEVYSNVTYDVRFGESTTMDVHVPDGAGPHPAVMLIHGGAWKWGEKENYDQASERFASAGYVAATINYRLLPAGRYPANIQDCLCALSFLRANADGYRIDPDRIAVSGYSAGGHLSALVGLGSQNPAHQPDCEWGPTTPPAVVIPGDSNYDLTSDPNWLVEEYMGGTFEEMPESYLAASPLHNVKSGMPPVLVVHGHDDLVPIEGAASLVDTLREHENYVRFLDLDGAGHVLSPTTASDGAYLQAATDMPEAWAVTFDFLAQNMGAP